MENIGVGMTFSDLGQTRVYPSLSDSSAERYPVGFMELLGAHHQDSSRYAFIHMPPMQLPGTPNTSSISFASCEAVTGEDKKRDYQENEYQEEHHKSNKRFKSTKISEQTKMRVPKVSFITKSQVNNLDDGYKWRKYGQKPVRNSPFPRSYYRCTTSWCNVKKRVERSFSDPSSVITTYEGQHTHPRPLMIISKNGSFGSNGSASRAHFDLIPTLPPQLHQLFDYNNHQQQQQELSLFGTQYLNRQEKGFDHDDDEDDDHVMKTRRTQDLFDGAGLVKDNGLLQDVVPAHIIKEEY